MTLASENQKTSLKQAFDPEHFRETGHALIDQLADYLQKATSGDPIMPVLPNITPDEMLTRWSSTFDIEPGDDFNRLMAQVLEASNHLHHPKYMGHQVSAPLPLSALCELVASLLNNGTAIYEMGPVSTAMEQHIIHWMAGLIGYKPGTDGILTCGGSMGNLTALLAARQVKAGHNSWQEGHQDKEPLAVLVSENAHYSIQRATQIMGWGKAGAVAVTLDDQFKMRRENLEQALQKAQKQGRKVIAVVANACSTATGTYDPLPEIADFCETHDLWLHIDGAHGASALVSEKYRHHLAGIDRADSVVWDAHKMMLMPALVTAVIFKEKHHSYAAFSQQAAYLFEREAQDEWYNLAQRTLECTKRMLSLKLYTCLKVYGTGIFSDHIDKTNENAKLFADRIAQAPDFELATAPESNIVCFRFTPIGITDPATLDELQSRLRRQIIEQERFYIVQTRLPQGQYLRCVFMNSLTRPTHFEELLDQIRELGQQQLA